MRAAKTRPAPAEVTRARPRPVRDKALRTAWAREERRGFMWGSVQMVWKSFFGNGPEGDSGGAGRLCSAA
ncbi:hypothetical protein GCM10009107_13630 [Ideonella azotifigens]|uniref:Uncharacterized protein n=1 Tax=Ideonella azotifigens TaxID=513160 RepID=A0ABN1JTB8_9BURK